MILENLIAKVAESDSVVDVLRLGRELRREAARHKASRSVARLLIAHCGKNYDTLTRLLLVRAAGGVDGGLVDDTLVALLDQSDVQLRQHAAWALSERPPVVEALPGIMRLAAGGGFGTMLAQLVVEQWSKAIPREIKDHCYTSLAQLEAPMARARLLETLGLIQKAAEGRDRAAGDAHAAFDPAPFGGCALSSIARSLGSPAHRRKAGGLRIAQVVLQGRIDADLESAGGGDSGGLATLLVSLGKALGERPEIDEVFTVARATNVSSRSGGRLLVERMSKGATLLRLPFGPERDLPVAEMWRYRAEIERGLERLFRRLGKLDGVHLRFADVGTLAASRIARRQNIPVFFTLAPDPHAVIRAAEQAGGVSRQEFADADFHEHMLFRAELVERVAQDAQRCGLFPRPRLEQDLRDLLDIDVSSDRGRFWTVPEGIDIGLPARAERERRATEATPPAIEELGRRVDRLGADRLSLPLLIGVGRLHPVKGFHRLVEAWAGDPQLFSTFNLLLVGGDLESPSTIEARMLEKIESVIRQYPRARRGLVLFGRRSNLDVARLLAVARWGGGSRIAAGGVFVCPSDKEEFGLAILEAMAAGLAVVTPDAGGPPTYIRDRYNGFLARTTSVKELRRAIRRAAETGGCESRTERARRLVRNHFTVDAMAGVLVRMYDLRADRSALESAA